MLWIQLHRSGLNSPAQTLTGPEGLQSALWPLLSRTSANPQSLSEALACFQVPCRQVGTPGPHSGSAGVLLGNMRPQGSDASQRLGSCSATVGQGPGRGLRIVLRTPPPVCKPPPLTLALIRTAFPRVPPHSDVISRCDRLSWGWIIGLFMTPQHHSRVGLTLGDLFLDTHKPPSSSAAFFGSILCRMSILFYLPGLARRPFHFLDSYVTILKKKKSFLLCVYPSSRG